MHWVLGIGFVIVLACLLRSELRDERTPAQRARDDWKDSES
jgi:hypothetical protein